MGHCQVMEDEIEKYNSEEETEGSQRFTLGRPLMIVSLPKKITYLIYLSVILLLISLVLLTAHNFRSASQPASKESDFPLQVIMTNLMNSKDSSSEETTTPDDPVFRSSNHSLLYSQIYHQFIIRKIPTDEKEEKKTDSLSGAVSNIFVAQAVMILTLQFAHIFLYLISTFAL